MQPRNFVSTFSARITAVQPDQLDREIESQLGELREFLSASHICWFVKRKSTTNLVRVYAVSRPGTPLPPAIVTPDILPYTFEGLGHGKVVLRRMEDLPLQAERDRQFLRDHLIESILLIPSTWDTADTGVLGVASSSWRRWPANIIEQLEILGNVIIAAVERRDAQKAQQVSEQRFQYLFEQVSIGIAIKNLSGQILFANPALCSTLGYPPEELRGMDTSQFIDAESAGNEVELFEKLHAGVIDSYKIEKRLTRKDGTKIWGRLRVSVLKNNWANPSLIIAMLEEITEQKAAEDALQRTKRELQQLAARLMQAQDEERHRIGRELHDDIGQRLALLAVELTNLKDALPATENPVAKCCAEEVLGQVSRLSDDIHQLSRQLHSSRLEYLGLGAALNELVTHLSRQHKLSIDLKCDSQAGSIPSDIAFCMFRIAQESLSNVIRHSGADRAFMVVTYAEGAIRLTIEDNGVGFDPSGRFEGIGLISMRERARILGGTLLVDSQPGRGTQIIVKIPIAASLPASAA